MKHALPSFQCLFYPWPETVVRPKVSESYSPNAAILIGKSPLDREDLLAGNTLPEHFAAVSHPIEDYQNRGKRDGVYVYLKSVSEIGRWDFTPGFDISKQKNMLFHSVWPL